ncbi:MAG: 5,10-methylenetetrahydrofolate reductase [Candidatus Lokiarchaeota archaeon]|nr:5,10-methylenetetrahydrofolate reductase [Candidatus Lokiarchaeota archaeon]
MSRPAYSNLMKAIKDGKFVFTGELEPVKTVSLDYIIHSAEMMKDYVVAANVTDGPQGFAYINSLVPSMKVQQEVGLETIYQCTVRDRNRIALMADVLAASNVGIKNILTLSGDHAALGDNPGAKPVYDLDCSQFIDLISHMVDKGTDIHGNDIDGKVEINIGSAVNPNNEGEPLEAEIAKLGRKVRVGADFIQTQTVFDIDKTKDFLKEIEKFNCPILVGLFPLKNYGIASYFDKYIPGVNVPKDLMKRLKKTKKKYMPDKKERKKTIADINLDFFRPFMKEIKQNTKAAGIHCMAVHYEKLFPRLFKDL